MIFYGRLAINPARGGQNDGITITADTVYYNGRALPDADARAFAPASITERPETHAGDVGYFRLSNEFYTDGTQLFLFGAPLPQSNGSTVIAIGERHFIHNNRVYHEREPIETADPESFEALNGVLGKDAEQVFFYTEPVRPAPDLASFSIVDGSAGVYATDAEHVYHIGQDAVVVFDKADPDSFVPTGWDGATRSDARDAHRRYRDGKPVE